MLQEQDFDCFESITFLNGLSNVSLSPQNQLFPENFNLQNMSADKQIVDEVSYKKIKEIDSPKAQKSNSLKKVQPKAKKNKIKQKKDKKDKKDHEKKIKQKKTKRIGKTKRKDVDGQHVFKLYSYGLKKICKKGYSYILDKFEQNDKCRRDFPVILLSYMQKQIQTVDSSLYQQIPQLQEKYIEKKKLKYIQQMKTPQDQDQKVHAQHALQTYENGSKVIKAFIIDKDPNKAMIIAYGALDKKKIAKQTRDNLKIALKKLHRLRKKLGLYSTLARVNFLQD